MNFERIEMAWACCRTLCRERKSCYKEQVIAYLGIDPTADSLHIGHLVE